MRIPTAQIDAHHLPRDRSQIDRDGLDELRASILKDGLRTPIEVVETPEGYGLLSGYRRLFVTRELHEHTQDPRFAEIEATLRAPASRTDALRQMIEENEIRRDISMWDRARIAARLCAGRLRDNRRRRRRPLPEPHPPAPPPHPRHLRGRHLVRRPPPRPRHAHRP